MKLKPCLEQITNSLNSAKKFAQIFLLVAAFSFMPYFGTASVKAQNTQAQEVQMQEEQEPQIEEEIKETVLKKGIYAIDKDVIINENEILTISPGSVFKFRRNAGMLVYGTLKAIGTEKEKIIFNGVNEEQWQNITIFGEYADNSILENCVISKGRGRKEIPYLDKYEAFTLGMEKTKGGGLLILFSGPVISNCIIENNQTEDNGGGLFIYKAYPKIEKNIIQNNITASAGGGIYVYKSEPLIKKNTITGNKASGEFRGGGVYISRCSIELNDNKIENNIPDNVFPDYLAPNFDKNAAEKEYERNRNILP